MKMIPIIDSGSQVTYNISRRTRENGVYSEVFPFNTLPSEIVRDDLEGIIGSGGQFSVHDENSPIYGKGYLNSGIPFLGICFGMQCMAYLLGGRVEKTGQREYGKTKIKIVKDSPLFKGLPQEFDVWMSHADSVVELPPGFEAIAYTENGLIAAMQDVSRKLYAVQFHPEVDHTQHGREILENFLKICGAKRTYDPTKNIDEIIGNIRETAGGANVVGGMSGGVDSFVASVLMHKAIGDRYQPIFVNNGLLRAGEAEEVMQKAGSLGLAPIYADRSDLFVNALKGVTDPLQKRKIIGSLFIDVFQEVAATLDGVKCLMQGTLYPDVIESVPLWGQSSVIKAHHNVGGLPEVMQLLLIEPFRMMFKDEVRAIGEKLRMPKDVIWRHPFPGPGLAVRMIGDVTPEKLEIIRKADKIYMDELHDREIYYDIDQAFAVLTDMRSVGVMGDEGTYEYVAALRAVNTNEFMTADVYPFYPGVIQAIAARIVNEVAGISRVVYDVTTKPPATIEWE
ncbi:glutamine-hydrolyzing GMP synthase [Candidatus Woesearchaeota archaeon]|nr:glutamine-hydrolyzing GMP synthase [Candidatus Woesearchaeota archaeon]